MSAATTLYGEARIHAAFANAATKRNAALMPYFTLGFPSREASLDIITAIAPQSDLLELGVPFSDPIADGPTVQHSSQVSLENGTTLAGCIEMVAELRQRGVTSAIMLFSYYNPFMAYGEAKLVEDARAAGVDGFIVPDLPPEESDEFDALVQAQGLALIHLLAPTSNPVRIDNVIARAKGFIYMVGVTGITGARSSIQEGLGAFVQQIKSKTSTPIAVGFGISSGELARQVSKFADGVIVGSALINAVNQADEKVAAATTFVDSLDAGLRAD